MTQEQFEKVYEHTRVIFWFCFAMSIFGALVEIKGVVLLAAFMILVMSAVHIIVRNLKQKL